MTPGTNSYRVFWMMYFFSNFYTVNGICDLRKQGQNHNATTCLNELLKNYDKRIRPNIFVKTTVIMVDLLVSNFWTIKESNMDFTMDFYLRQYWMDERLSFLSDDPDQMLTLTNEIWREIWIPSSYFVRSKKSYFHDVTTDNFLFQIGQNGSIFLSMRVTVTTSCHLEFYLYPHDKQRCTLTLESYGYKTEDVVYYWNHRNDNTSTIAIPGDLSLLQYEMVSVEQEEHNNTYNAGIFSSLTVIFNMKRRIGFFIIETYIPSCIIVALSWISFWIPPESVPARVALGITTALTMVTISGSARAGLPRVSYVKAIDWYLLICLLFVFGAMLEYTLVSIFHLKYRFANKTNLGDSDLENEVENNSEFDTKWYQFSDEKSTRFSKLENDNFLHRPKHKRLQQHQGGSNRKDRHTNYNQPTESTALNIYSIDMDRVSRLGYLIAFLLFNVIYWTTFSWLNQ